MKKDIKNIQGRKKTYRQIKLQHYLQLNKKVKKNSYDQFETLEITTKGGSLARESEIQTQNINNQNNLLQQQIDERKQFNQQNMSYEEELMAQLQEQNDQNQKLKEKISSLEALYSFSLDEIDQKDKIIIELYQIFEQYNAEINY